MRYSAPILLTLPVLVVAAALSIISYSQGRAAAGQLAGQNIEQVHDQIDGAVRAFLSHPQRVVELNTSLLRRGELNVDDVHSWKRTLVDEFRAFGMLSAISWGAEDGQATWIARYGASEDSVFYAVQEPGEGQEMVEFRVHADGSVDDQQANAFAFNVTSRPWYRAPADAGEPTWCKPFVWVGGDTPTLGIAFGRPYVGDSGQLIGVVDADLSLQDISHFLEQMEIAINGRAFIVDRDGLLIATSSGGALVDNENGRRPAHDSEQAFIVEATRAIGREYGDYAKMEGSVQMAVDVGGRTELVEASPLKVAGGIDWVIVTSVPETDFTGPLVAGQRRAWWFAGMALLATVILGVWLGRLIVGPMLQLTDHVHEVGEGNLDATIELTQSPEMQVLSREINAMVGGLQDRVRLRQSLAVAMEVQQNLLPSKTPDVRGIDVAGHSTYCDETGGDYYDYLEITGLNERALAVVIGDVMGHGVAAAMLMANARGILRSQVQQAQKLGGLLVHLNELLVPDTGGKRFMTMLLMVVDAERKLLRWASAGHDPPFAYDPQKDSFLDLDGGGLPLGIAAGEQYVEEPAIHLSDGCIIVTATDGVWEARNAEGEMFGRDRVRQCVRRHASLDAQGIADCILHELSQYIGELEHDDDVTFVVIRVGDHGKAGPGSDRRRE